MDGILTGPAIAEAVRCGRIFIEGFNPDRVNPASYDLTLGDQVSIYEQVVNNRPRRERHTPEDGRLFEPFTEYCLSSDKPNEIATYKIDPATGWVLKPGIGYLMHTVERVRTDHYVPVLDGKSTIGRLFIMVHVTAGYGDPGFDGQYTLEVLATHPVRVYPGMRICQIRFHPTHGRIKLYEGRYRGDRAYGAVPAEVSGLKS
jgi:dCTP deaminase